MTTNRSTISILTLLAFLALVPALATARVGGGCGGPCNCSSENADPATESESAIQGCRQGKGQIGGSVPDEDAATVYGQGKGNGKGRHGGQGQGRQGGGKGKHAGGNGNHAKMADARNLVHQHELLSREVEEIPGGVRTTTTSEDKEVVESLKRHVEDMKEILESGGRVRHWDPLFVELFDHAEEIEMKIKSLDNGLEVEEVSDNPRVVQLIRAHARKVSEFVSEGPDAAHRVTPVPPLESSPK